MLTIQNYLKSLALAAATLVAAASVAFAQDTAKLSGTVVDEKGKGGEGVPRRRHRPLGPDSLSLPSVEETDKGTI